MKNRKGFTLIELMIVVAIIGILSAIAIPKFADLIRKSNEGATKGNLGALRSAISIYYGENEGWFPSNASGATTMDLASVLTMQNGKYLQAIPQCYCPPYHDKSSVVETVDFSSFTETTGSAGSWGYQGSNTPAANTELWGNVWVDCTHTDSKNVVWAGY
jgi:prepilin-type N-terminal cleavage/methylation domain-containing protein